MHPCSFGEIQVAKEELARAEPLLHPLHQPVGPRLVLTTEVAADAKLTEHLRGGAG